MESPPWALSGGTATYPAEQTRRAMFAWAARTAANSPGIIAGGLLSPTDMQLSAASSGLVVNISVGECLIGGTEGGVQGGYYARNASTSSVTLATANGTNPRIDAVVGMVGDAGYTLPSGSTSGQVTLVGVTGTPTAGATLSNLNGAPATPASSLLLGYVLVPAAATSLTSGDIGNEAGAVQGQTTGRYIEVEGNDLSDLTTSSVTFVNPSTTLNLTWTPSLAVIEVAMSAHVQCDTANSQVAVGLLIDGTEIGRSQVTCPTINAPFSCSWKRIFPVTPNVSHTITVGLAVPSGGGNGTLKNSGALPPRYQVHELVL